MRIEKKLVIYVDHLTKPLCGPWAIPISFPPLSPLPRDLTIPKANPLLLKKTPQYVPIF